MKRNTYTPNEKAKMVLEALRGERTLNEIASANEVHPKMLSRWKRDAESKLYILFQDDTAKKRKEEKAHEEELQSLYSKIGQLSTQNEWLKKKLGSELSVQQRRAMVDMADRRIPIITQVELLGLNRSGLYYKTQPPSEEDLRIKRMIDEVYTAHPEFGYRRVQVWLEKEYHVTVNHKAVYRHMKEMGIQAIYPRQNTSKPNPGHQIFPYLLNDVDITRPDQVWSIDITYIPIRTDWLYLVAIIDWFSRYVLSWRVSDSLEIDFVLEACCEALRLRHPEIMNSDQGSHFTSPQYTSLFLDAGSRISMDHRGRAYDNIFVERLWRSVKYENVYLNSYERPLDARKGLDEYLRYYNEKRYHSSLNYQTPAAVYFQRIKGNPSM